MPFPERELCASVPYSDVENPSGMEQARLVRLALSMVIDREAINTEFLDGMGIALYSEYMGPEYPGWNSNRRTGCFDRIGNLINCESTKTSVPWQLEDGELSGARTLLDAAGYPLIGDTRQNFSPINLQTYEAESGTVGPIIGQIIMDT